jgi:hypothetical protein
MLEMQADGHLMCSHCNTHTLWQTGTGTNAGYVYMYWETLQELIASRESLKSLGVGAGRFYFAHPSGTSLLANLSQFEKNEMIKLLCQNNYHVRMTDYTASDGIYGHSESGIQRNFTLPNYSCFKNLAPAVTCQTFDGTPSSGYLTGKALIDRAVLHNDALVLYWHEIKDSGGDMTIAQFTALLDYIIAQGVEVCTFADLMTWNPNNKRFKHPVRV